MTEEKIIEMATKVYGKCEWHESALQHLKIFAKLVAEEECEDCAKVCDKIAKKSSVHTFPVALDCANAIRARGKNERSN